MDLVTPALMITDDEIEAVVGEAAGLVRDPDIASRLSALDLGLSLSERAYACGVLTERIRARAEAAKVRQLAARLALALQDYAGATVYADDYSRINDTPTLLTEARAAGLLGQQP